MKKSINNGDAIKTYYVYDDFDRLRYVIPPKASKQIGTVIPDTVYNELIYYYKYDKKGRKILKKLPGAEPVYMVYDERDRLVLSQDGKQRANNKWQFVKYDALNRKVMTGVFTPRDRKSVV